MTSRLIHFWFRCYKHQEPMRSCWRGCVCMCVCVCVCVWACLDETLSFESHISRSCRIAMLNLQRLKLIRCSLGVDACKTLVQCLVISHLDYANAILANIPTCQLKKLQRVQNIAAKLILRKQYTDSSTESRKALHWLPMTARIDFKILMLVFKCLNNSAPEYLQALITRKKPSRQGLRFQNDDKLLEVPFTRRHTFGDRSFSVYGPKIWNLLP